jgi:hypothetical protein
MRQVLVLGVLTACFHDPAPQSVVTPPDRSSHVRAVASDPLAFLPVDSEAVLSIDAGQLRTSWLWKTLEPVVSARAGDALARVHARCGVDLLGSIKQIAMGISGIGDMPSPTGVVVVHGLDRKALMACMDRLIGTHPGVTIANGIVTAKAPPGEPSAAFTFANASTLVMVTSPTASPDQLAAVIARGAPLHDSPEFVELLGQIQPRSTAWFAINGNAKVFDKVSTFGIRPKSVIGSVDLANGLTGAVRMSLDSADSAHSFAGLVQGQLGLVKALVEDIEVTSEDTDVVLHVVMTQVQLESLVGMLGAFTTQP